MKGLDAEELHTMGIVHAGWLHFLGARESVIDRLIKRGLLRPITINCGAPDCPGHQSFDMTPTGAMIFNIVRS